MVTATEIHKEKTRTVLNGIPLDPVSVDIDENEMSTLMELCYEPRPLINNY